MNEKLRSDLNIALVIVLMLSVAIIANHMGGQITGATTLDNDECFISQDCDDGNPCTMDSCFGGSCMHETIDDCKK